MTDLLTAHRTLLERRRHTMNLVGPGPIAPHYADSAAALGWLTPSGRWADLGAGAGFPGIPFAARFPEVAVDLVEIRQKRCTFLEAVLLEASAALKTRPAPVRVLCTRIEDLPDHSYDGIVARALAPPAEVLEHARRLLVPGGTVVLFLQDTDAPGAPDFTPAGEHRYVVDGKARRAVALHLAST